jgi:hypothetical protein
VDLDWTYLLPCLARAPVVVRRTRQRSSSKKIPSRREEPEGHPRAPDPPAALVLRHSIQNSNRREIHLRPSSPNNNPRCESCQTSRRKCSSSDPRKKWRDIAESLIETSPLLGSPRGVAGGGARRSTNRLGIAGRRARERNPRDGMGMREERIEMNGLGMRVDRNERARFPEFEQLLLTSGPRD